jgi:hypothetical protein
VEIPGKTNIRAAEDEKVVPRRRGRSMWRGRRSKSSRQEETGEVNEETNKARGGRSRIAEDSSGESEEDIE